MGTNRLEAFSDGVLAIIITIMVLELRVPHGTELADLKPMVPKLLGYVLSFVYVGIYWNSHHHMFHVTESVNGAVLWGNLHLLFWLSLIPFVTGWMGENHFTPIPTALYGMVLLMCAIAYTILQFAIIRMQGEHSKVAKAVGQDRKGKVSLALYVIAIACSFFLPMVACALYAAVALIWFIPDRRLERVLIDREER